VKAHHLSGSKVDLAQVCTYWARGDVAHEQRPSGAAATRGVNVHGASDDHFNKRAIRMLTDEELAIWASLRTWSDAMPAWTHSEIPILYDAGIDAASICEIGSGGERDYLGVTALRIPTRLDLVRLEGDTVWICDIKTGSRSNCEPAATNVQLATQAVAAARLFHVERAMVGLVFPLKTKVHVPEWHELAADALDEHAGKLHRTLRVIPDSEPARGSHCWHCPIGPSRDFRSTCPAWAENVEAAE
jgi:hypothetical protein